jgi:hypothetical protein
MPRLAVALVVCALCVSACGDDGGPTQPSQQARIEYHVTGSATRASMTYATAGNGTAQAGDRALPWSFDWTANRGDFVYLSAQNAGQAGCVTVEIKVRGATFKTTQSCGAFVIATASGSVE